MSKLDRLVDDGGNDGVEVERSRGESEKRMIVAFVGDQKMELGCEVGEVDEARYVLFGSEGRVLSLARSPQRREGQEGQVSKRSL
jgi:hypothetical protein